MATANHPPSFATCKEELPAHRLLDGLIGRSYLDAPPRGSTSGDQAQDHAPHAAASPPEADQSPVLYQNTKIPKYQTVFCPKYQKSKRVPCKIPKNQTGACVWYSKFQRFKNRFDFLVFCLVGQIEGTSKKPKYQTE
jgi:hypothetical protein